MDLHTAYDVARQVGKGLETRNPMEIIWDEAVRIAQPETNEDGELLALVLRDHLKADIDDGFRKQLHRWLSDRSWVRY